MYTLDAWDYWRLAERLTVNEAAHLIIGILPGEIEAMEYNGGELTAKSHVRYSTDLAATVAALTGAIESGRIPVHSVAQNREHDLYEGVYVASDSVRSWLASKGVRSQFFFPDLDGDSPDYLDQHNPRYAPKLAAAVRAWQAVTDPGGKSAKQALLKWLREHAAEFRLTDEEGKVNETGIEEVAKVANWQTTGGAPKTPSE